MKSARGKFEAREFSGEWSMICRSVGRSVGFDRLVRCSCSWPDKKSWPRLFYRPRHTLSVGQPTGLSLSLSFSSYYIIIILGDKKGSPGSKGRVSSAVKALPKFETRSPGGWIGVAAVVAFPFPPPPFSLPSRNLASREAKESRSTNIFLLLLLSLP